MKAKILLALDGSEPSMKAAQYVANLLGHQPHSESQHCRTDVSATLFHVLFPIRPFVLGESDYEIPALLWADEFERRGTCWEEAKDVVESKVFQKVRKMLMHAGFRGEQIQTKFASGSDAAHEILNECEAGDYDTVVMGKRGLSRIQHFLTGSVTEKVVRHAKGRAVWIIE